MYMEIAFMKTLTLDEMKIVSGGRHAEGAYNANGPDRTREQARHENYPGREWSSADLRNAGLALSAVGAVTPGVPGRVIGALGAGAALIGGWERNGGNH